MPPRSVSARRVQLLQKAIPKSGFDLLLLQDPTNVRYLTGLKTSYAWLAYTREEAHLMTDGRYIETAREVVEGHTIHLKKPGPPEDLYKLLKKSGAEQIGVEASLPFGTAEALRGALEGVEIAPATALLGSLRRAKDKAEVAAIVAAQKIAEEILAEALGHLADAGPDRISEKSLALILRLLMLERGVEPSFDPIVATGKNSSRPHYSPSPDAMIGKGPLLIDMGVVVDGYCSDMTRMVHVGKPTAKFEKIHDALEKAVAAAVKAVAPGVKASAVHAKAVAVLKKAELDKQFTHGLGHGVGMAIHEAPSVNATSEEVLAEGDVITIEPGVYVKGWGGLRVEDMVLVTKKGGEVLTTRPRTATIIG